MTKPLNDYFIFSSHNTFLNRHLYGEGSIEMYNYALNEGCRLLELECYDGENEPKISEGKYLSQDVLLKDALLNLRENSFKSSNFPVLISLDNYCKKDQQIAMAQYFKDILKDIYTLNLNKLPEKYPSPKELEGKFIIKEIKNMEISRKSSLPMGSIGNMIRKSDSEYNFNINIYECINSKESNSFSIPHNLNKDLEEELMNFLNHYSLDISKKDDLFDFEEFEDIPDENIILPYLISKTFTPNDRKNTKPIEDINFLKDKGQIEQLNKLNSYGSIVINEWVDNKNSLINKQSDLVNSYHNFFNKNEDYIEEDDKMLSANRANNPNKKKNMGITILSEIKEKEDDYESSYKKMLSRSRDSDNLTNTLNRINSKFSDSNLYQKNMNSDSLHFSMLDKNVDLSSQNRNSQNRSNSKKQISTINYTISNPINNNNNTNFNNCVTSYNSNKSLNHSKTYANDRQTPKIRHHEQSYNTVKEIQDLAGLIKKKFYISKVDDELYYNPWDCPTIKESELFEFFKNYHLRSKVVKFCKSSFLKVHPSATNKISANNFDPVKAWICGVQMAAINIQTLEDDHVLINKMFFRFNRNTGYVLKPEFLRNTTNIYDRFYLNPLMKLKIDVISCLMLQTSIRNFNKFENIFFESYLVGSWEDDKINPKYKSKTYEKNLINLIFDNESIKFEVYEPDLCFWMIKIYLSNTVIARSCIPLKIMNEGIRTVPLFDMNCNEFDDCVILVRVSKTMI